MDDDTASIRRLRLLRILLQARRPLSRRDLSRRVGRSPKSIGRDIDAIGYAGYPVVIELRGRQQFYRLAPDALGGRPGSGVDRAIPLDADLRHDDGRDDLVH